MRSQSNTSGSRNADPYAANRVKLLRAAYWTTTIVSIVPLLLWLLNPNTFPHASPYALAGLAAATLGFALATFVWPQYFRVQAVASLVMVFTFLTVIFALDPGDSTATVWFVVLIGFADVFCGPVAGWMTTAGSVFVLLIVTQYIAPGQFSLQSVISAVLGYLGGGTLFFLFSKYDRELYRGVELSADRDPLTGVLNRRGFEKSLLPSLLRNDHVMSIAMLDLDHFKAINDTFGHEVGDEVIQLAANVVLENIRDTDFVCRYGGDEFVVVLNNAQREQAFEVCERVRKEFKDRARAVLSDASPISPTMSLGVETISVGEVELHEVIKHIDRLMYAAKAHGEDRTMIGGLA